MTQPAALLPTLTDDHDSDDGEGRSNGNGNGSGGHHCRAGELTQIHESLAMLAGRIDATGQSAHQRMDALEGNLTEDVAQLRKQLLARSDVTDERISAGFARIESLLSALASSRAEVLIDTHPDTEPPSA